MKLQPKLLIWFLVVGIVPVLIAGLISLRLSTDNLETQAFDHLSAVSTIKRNQINTYFDMVKRDLVVLAQSQGIWDLYEKLYYYHDRNEFKPEDVIDPNEYQFKEIDEEYGAYPRTWMEKYGYEDMFIIHPKTGHVMFSHKKNPDIGQSLLVGQYKDSNLAELWRKVCRNKHVQFADFRLYAPNGNKPASFLGTRIYDEKNQFRAVLALQLPIDIINSIMTEKTGMGETGETYLIGPEHLMRSASRHDQKHHSVAGSFTAGEKGQVDTPPVEMALSGKSDSGLFENYRDRKVLCNYAPVDVFGVKWAMLAEIEKQEAFASATAMMWIIVGVVVVSILVVATIALLIARAITKPVRHCMELADSIRRGDLSRRLEIISNDEIGQLTHSLNTMADGLQEKAELAELIAGGDLTSEVQLASDQDQLGKALQRMLQNLRDIIRDVSEGGVQVSAGSKQVKDASNTLSQGAMRQAESLAEITTTMSKISEQTQTNAKHATEANQLAGSVRDAADKGNEHMNAMVNAMSEISNASQEINKIIKVIDDIAFQTNLLALNAAVEAARAGRHGKGFAVVAEEVRNLAARSAKAARETAELIEGSVKKVDNGSEIANQTAEALKEIVDGVTKVTDLVGGIAQASNQQATEVESINQGIGQIDNVTQQNTASAEETASAAVELSSQSAKLQQILRRFKLQGLDPASGVYKLGTNAQALQKALPPPEPAHGPQPGHDRQSAGVAQAPQSTVANTPSSDWGSQHQIANPNEVIALDDSEFGKY